MSLPLLHGSACGGEAIVENDGTGGSTGTGTGNTGNATHTTTTSTSGVGGSGTVTVGQGGASMTETACWTPIPDLGCPSVNEANMYYGVCTQDGYFIDGWVSGPYVQPGGQCCYEILTAHRFCGVGRPLMIEQRAVTARAVVDSRGWVGRHGAETELGTDARAALAEAYTRDGLYEHASVASFARVALELMALGAPAELVADAHRAALDEIEHARLCLTLASRFGGEPVGVAPLELPRALELHRDLVSLAVSTFLEGCIGETLSAALAQEQAARATDPEVRPALERIAVDEARHAELAWRTVAWALRHGGAKVREAIARLLPDANRHAPDVAAPADDALERYGKPSLHVVREVQRRALLDVVLPCARALVDLNA